MKSMIRIPAIFIYLLVVVHDSLRPRRLSEAERKQITWSECGRLFSLPFVSPSHFYVFMGRFSAKYRLKTFCLSSRLASRSGSPRRSSESVTSKDSLVLARR